MVTGGVPCYPVAKLSGALPELANLGHDHTMIRQGWEAGSEPWVRAQWRLSGPDPSSRHLMQCPFCGAQKLTRAFEDIRADSGRIDLYCESDNCDARTMTLIVMRDATVETEQRPDVRALRAIEQGKYEQRHEPMKAKTLAEIGDDETMHADAVLTRRTKGTPVIDLRSPWDPSPSKDGDED